VRRGLDTLALLLCLLPQSGCGPEPATVLLVQVTAKPGVYPPMSLDVSLTPQSGAAERTLLGKGDQTITLPTTFVIRTDGWSGPATVGIRAKNKEDRLLGEGSANTSIIPDEQVGVTVELLPADFPVNDRYQASQMFSTAASARQVSSDGKGNFVGVWEDNECLGTLNRCDVYYRMFDPGAQPKLNGVTNKTEEHIANEATATYDMPAVAMQPDGHFVMAWYRADSTLGSYDIRSRAFLPNGRPDDQSEGGKEIVLSLASATGQGVPDIAGLNDHNYLVVWHQVDSNKRQVMGRFLGPHGRPTKPGTGSNEPFLVAEFADPQTSPVPAMPNPAVARGPDDPKHPQSLAGFMVIWRDEQGKLWGRTYGNLAVPTPGTAQPFNISGASSQVSSFDVSPMLDGYAVVWEENLSCGADVAPPCIRLRRYSLVGAALESAWTVNTITAGEQKTPAVAMRSDGGLLVAWCSKGDGMGDGDGAIRGRRVLSVGLPVGEDLLLNTTTTREQDSPSLAQHNSDSFVVLFRDDSLLGPDNDLAAIRGRILYPIYEAKDGKIGALCDTAAPCKTGMKCINAGVGNRCVLTCDSSLPNPSCPDGGKCQTLSGNLGDVCMY